MIEIQDLQKVVEQNTVLDITELTVRDGEVVGIVGPADSGKEMLLQILTGRETSSAGFIRLAGFDSRSDRNRLSKLVGVLFKENNLYAHMTAQANLAVFARLYRLPKSRVEEVIRVIGLADHASIDADGLGSSLGRRLAFGRAIMHQPKILILVDPFASCDEATVALLGEQIKRQASEGTAILVLCEDATNLEAICDVMYQLRHGRIISSHSPGDAPAEKMPFMIPARLEGSVALVDPADILYVFAQDDRAFLQTADGAIPTQFTLTDLERRLSRSGFFRAHRGYLVNLQHVGEVIPFTRDSYTLKLKDAEATQIPLSKSAARELRELLGY
ncbi:MAG: LytTR family transcriptional regulator DNA-binding domain-containing protein [Anaerolineales bacterium]|jgi:ABC-2 type transport system ATP-binding protein